MSVHHLKISLVPMERNQFLCMMISTAANTTLVTVFVKAGEILITSHLMDSTTVIKETVLMS